MITEQREEQIERQLTSQQWQEEFPNTIVWDPDGWDRKNFHYSWFEELITLQTYLNRMMISTCVRKID